MCEAAAAAARLRNAGASRARRSAASDHPGARRSTRYPAAAGRASRTAAIGPRPGGGPGQ